MATFTQNKGFTQQAHNDANWDAPNNANFAIIDASLGGVASINVTGVGSSPTALAQALYKNLSLSFSGALGNNVNYQLPSGVQGSWLIKSSCSGSFTVTLSSAGGGTSVVISTGLVYHVYCDGTDVVYANVVGTNSKIITDWDQALLYKNTYLSGDVATSLLASGYEGQTGGSGRAGVGVYYAVDSNNGVMVVHAYPGNNRWQRMYIAGVWQNWSKIPNATEIVRRDYKLLGNANSAVSGSLTPGADFYLVDTGSSNIPTWASVGDMLLSYNKDNLNGTQFLISRSGKAAIRGVTAGTWTNWIDAYNYGRFESSQLTYVNDGTGIVAHGLGVVPRQLDAYLICLTAQAGIAVGNRYKIQSGQISLLADATNVSYSISGSGISVMASGNTSVFLTPSNFRLVVQADL